MEGSDKVRDRRSKTKATRDGSKMTKRRHATHRLDAVEGAVVKGKGAQQLLQAAEQRPVRLVAAASQALGGGEG